MMMVVVMVVMVAVMVVMVVMVAEVTEMHLVVWCDGGCYGGWWLWSW